MPSSREKRCGETRNRISRHLRVTAWHQAPELPDDETLRPVTDAVRALLGVLGTGERLTLLGRVGCGRLVGRAVVGLAGFEPATSATQTRRASQTALQPVPGRV